MFRGDSLASDKGVTRPCELSRDSGPRLSGFNCSLATAMLLSRILRRAPGRNSRVVTKTLRVRRGIVDQNDVTVAGLVSLIICRECKSHSAGFQFDLRVVFASGYRPASARQLG